MIFPRAIEDTPAYPNFPGGFEADGRARARYEEGVFVGYRFYDHILEQREQVLFPFGYGLSYTSFTLHDISLDMSKDHGNDHIEVRVSVSNMEKRPGTETFQVYVGRAYHSEQHPWKTLVAFAQVSLHAGETRETSLKLSRRGFAFYDESAEHWVVEASDYLVHVGTSVSDIASAERVHVPETIEYAS